MVQARVTVLDGAAMCCFEVTDSTGISNSETIGVERVMPAMAELGACPCLNTCGAALTLAHGQA